MWHNNPRATRTNQLMVAVNQSGSNYCQLCIYIIFSIFITFWIYIIGYQSINQLLSQHFYLFSKSSSILGTSIFCLWLLINVDMIPWWCQDILMNTKGLIKPIVGISFGIFLTFKLFGLFRFHLLSNFKLLC